jgi:integrase
VRAAAASGEGVIRYEGKNGVRWRIKFRDSSGRQVMETLRPEDAPRGGWTREAAQRALGARLAEMEQTRWKKPERVTFAAFAERFEADALPGRNLKSTTLTEYETMLRRHLLPHFGDHELAAIEAADVDAYIAAKSAAGLSAKTIVNTLGLLRVMFRTARRWKLVAHNPMEEIDPPRVASGEMNVLTEAEVPRLIAAYRQLEADPPEKTKAAEWRQARRIVTVALGTGLRRGELLALRWRDIALLEGKLQVREAWVCGQFQAPKSVTSVRAFEVGAVTLAALNEQWQESRYRSDDDLVFCHLELGSPLNASKLTILLRTAIKKAGITKRFRVFHDMRHTAITHDAAAGNPQAYVQMKAGHAHSAITERYVHAAAVLFPGAGDRTEARLFAGLTTEEAPS